MDPMQATLLQAFTPCRGAGTASLHFSKPPVHGYVAGAIIELV